MNKLKKTPFVSVVIPVLNCETEVLECVASLKLQSYPEDCFEVIIVDNGSTDLTKDKILSCDVNYVLCPERGRSKALNYGIIQSKGEIICTTDISCRPEKGWITTIVNDFLNNPDVACVAGEIKLLKTNANLVIDFQEHTNYMSPMHAIKRTKIPFFPFADGANASFRKNFFDEVGMFEDSFIKAADVEICNRLFILSNYKILFDYNAVVWESGEPNLKELLKQRFRMGIGWNLLMKKYPLLYQQSKRKRNLRNHYWRISNTLKNLKTFILQLFQNDKNKFFKIITFLMSVSQSYGGLYGKYYLRRKKISPAPIDDFKIKKFIESNVNLQERIIVNNENDFC